MVLFRPSPSRLPRRVQRSLRPFPPSRVPWKRETCSSSSTRVLETMSARTTPRTRTLQQSPWRYRRRMRWRCPHPMNSTCPHRMNSTCSHRMSSTCSHRMSSMCPPRMSSMCSHRMSSTCPHRMNSMCSHRMNSMCPPRMSSTCPPRMSSMCSHRMSSTCPPRMNSMCSHRMSSMCPHRLPWHLPRLLLIVSAWTSASRARLHRRKRRCPLLVRPRAMRFRMVKSRRRWVSKRPRAYQN